MIVIVVRLVIVIRIVIIQIVRDVILMNQIDLFDFKVLPLDLSCAFIFCPRETNTTVVILSDDSITITINVIVIVSFSILSEQWRFRAIRRLFNLLLLALLTRNAKAIRLL